MPRKNTPDEETSEEKVKELFTDNEKKNNKEEENLQRMLGAV